MRTTIYILRTEKPKIYKIGITKNTALHRAKQIRASSRLLVLPILELRLFVAPTLEAALHRLLARFQRVQRGSGKTEYFRLPWPIFQATKAAIWLIWLTEIIFLATLCLFLIFLFYLCYIAAL